MNPKSAIAKGKRYENYLAQQIRESGLDIRAGREIGSGSGKAKGDLRTSLPYLIEAKNEKGVSRWFLERVDQAKHQAEIGFSPKENWCLVIRDPRTPEGNSEDYAIVNFSNFLELCRKAQEPKIKNPDRIIKWKLERLIQAAKDLLKEVDML